MAISLPVIITGARDFARCLKDSGKLKFPIPILNGGLLPLIEAHLSSVHSKRHVIRLKRVQVEEEISCVARYERPEENFAEIYYSSKLNPCWRRYAIAKELTHMAFDTPSEFFTGYATIAQEYINQTPVAPSSNAYKSETLCKYGAIELLLPWELRPELKKMVADGKTDREIAEYCRCPEQWVSFLLHSEYGQTSGAFHSWYDKNIASDWSAEGIPPSS